MTHLMCRLKEREQDNALELVFGPTDFICGNASSILGTTPGNRENRRTSFDEAYVIELTVFFILIIYYVLN